MTDFTELKQAILNNNMSAVCRAYEGLTGEAIKPTKKSRGRKAESSELSRPATSVNPDVMALQAQLASLQQAFNIATTHAQPAQQRTRFGGGANRFNPDVYQNIHEPGEELINDNVVPTPRGSIPRDSIDVVPNESLPPKPGRTR